MSAIWLAVGLAGLAIVVAALGVFWAAWKHRRLQQRKPTDWRHHR